MEMSKSEVTKAIVKEYTCSLFIPILLTILQKGPGDCVHLVDYSEPIYFLQFYSVYIPIRNW